MATSIIMPKNGMAMEEGKLIKWLKNVGDRVEVDDPLIEIETDKITMEEPAMVSGVLLAQWAGEGDTVPVLQTIGWIGEEGEAVPEREAPAPAEMPAPAQEEAATTAAPAIQMTGGSGVPATPYAKKLAAEGGIDIAAVAPTGKFGEVTGSDVEKAVNATPLAQRMAADKGVSLDGVAGSGWGGKVRAEDVAGMAAPVQQQGSVSKPMSGMRKAVAQGMMNSHTQIPSVTEHLRADVTSLLALRAQINEGSEQKISINDMVMKAVARALGQHKELLVSADGDNILYHQDVNLGMAVALDEGLIVPVIRGADKLSLGALAETARDLATRARAGKLGPDEYRGATFTVSNMGAFGLEMFTPIINLPEAAILGVCAIVDELALEDGEICVRKKMGLSLTFDHRLIDGVPPAKFLLTLRGLLENPMQILL